MLDEVLRLRRVRSSRRGFEPEPEPAAAAEPEDTSSAQGLRRTKSISVPIAVPAFPKRLSNLSIGLVGGSAAPGLSGACENDGDQLRRADCARRISATMESGLQRTSSARSSSVSRPSPSRSSTNRASLGPNRHALPPNNAL